VPVRLEAQRVYLLRVLIAAAFVGVAGAAAGQTSAAGVPARTEDVLAIDGPPAPIAPAVVTRDERGGTTIRATRLSEPLRIDGALDEALYRDVEPVSGLIQIEPRPGEPERQRTDVWISFDDDNVYYTVRCWESDMSAVIATEMRRDAGNIASSSDFVSVMFDTFYDRRNGYAFNVNAIGGRQDGQVVNNRQFLSDFNLIWDVKAGRFEGGWTIEAAIPFKSLRYRPGRQQIWGFNMLRRRPATNETAYLQRMPPGRGLAAILQANLAATVVGIEAPPPSRNLEIKPYVTSSLTSDTTVMPRVSNDPGGDVGVDLKYAVTQGLALDVTVNTDFAQVEADEQQINLTRFSLFFPEKREFFLENAGTFGFGGVTTAAAGDVPVLFYSRRIGLNAGRLVPLDVGGRVTGRVGRYTLGLVNIQTGDETVSRTPSTNFSVLRLKRDVLRGSSIGLIATRRSVGQSGSGSSPAYGADGTFAFGGTLAINSYWAQSRTPDVRDDDTSYRLQLDYPGDRYGVQVERLAVGANFNPEVGFVRRDDMRRTYGQFRFSPRPRASRPIARTIRRFSYIGNIAHIENGAGQLETRERSAEFALEFLSSDRFSVSYNNLYELLPAPFRIAPGITLPVGGYEFANVEVAYSMGLQRRRAIALTVERGTFYNGHRTVVSMNRGRVQFGNQFFIEPSYSMNHVDLVQGAFTTHLAGTRVTYTMTPLMFTSALVQYNSGSNSVSVNARLRWEYRPGSELFVVYNEQRDTRARAFPDLANRAFIVKVNRLLRF
jgi:hypothetical protein